MLRLKAPTNQTPAKRRKKTDAGGFDLDPRGEFDGSFVIDYFYTYLTKVFEETTYPIWAPVFRGLTLSWWGRDSVAEQANSVMVGRMQRAITRRD